jgi:predicted DNA-binding ribbon-helix-helix protein
MSSAIRVNCLDFLMDGESLRDAIEGISLMLRVAEEFSYWIRKGQ